MIEININDNGYEVSGHADYNEEGKDIVCAAVSTLAFTGIEALQKYELFHDVEEGEGFLSVCVDEPDLESVSWILCTIEGGFRMVQEQYPLYVQINEA